MENTMLRDLGEYIEQLVNGQVAPEIVEHEGVDYIRTSYGYEQLCKPKTHKIEVNSLSGLVKMVRNSVSDSEEVYGIHTPFIVRVDFNYIEVISALNDDKTRNYLVEANPMIPSLRIGYGMSVEEMTELTKEICKRKRGKDNHAAIVEEVADVLIMIEQLKIMCQIGSKELNDVKWDKIKRLEERLKNGY